MESDALQTPLDIVGPVGLRRGAFTHVCEEHLLHAHNYPHTTIATGGPDDRLRVTLLGAVDQVVELASGDAAPVPAGVAHRIKRLTPTASYVCVFAVRDGEGLVTETYTAPVANLVDDPAYL